MVSPHPFGYAGGAAGHNQIISAPAVYSVMLTGGRQLFKYELRSDAAFISA